MHALHHATVDLNDAFVAVLRQFECGNHLSRLLDVFGRLDPADALRLPRTELSERMVHDQVLGSDVNDV